MYPFQQAVVDLFQLASEVYIASADKLMGWLEVEHLPKSSTSSRLKSTFRRWFRRISILEILSCDGGTNFVSEETKNFLSAWCIQLCVSSTHYPQSNRHAEAVIKSVKRLLRGNTGPGVPSSRMQPLQPSYSIWILHCNTNVSPLSC